MSYGDDYEGGRGRTAPRPPELRTRRPTGNVSFPFLLIEGEPKGGKSYALAALSNSPRVGRTFILELGEATMDEYASLGPFEIIVHDGTWSDIRDQVKAAMAVPMEPDRPNVIGIDSGSHFWGLLKDWTDARARRSRAGVAKLRDDPDAEIDASMNLWNDAKDRWHDIMDDLLAWPGIAIVTARGAEKSKVENGQPVANQTEYAVEAEKTLVFDVTAQVRFERGKKPRLMAVRSLFVDVPSGGVELPREATLDHLVFDVLSGGRAFSPSGIVLPQLGVTVASAKVRVLQAIQRMNASLGEAEAKAEAGRLWKEAFPQGDPKEVPEALLVSILAKIGTPPPDKDPQGQERPPQAPQGDDPAQVRTRSADEVIREIKAFQKRDLVPKLTEAGLPTTGNLAALQDRLIHHLGLDEAPFDPPKADQGETPPPTPRPDDQKADRTGDAEAAPGEPKDAGEPGGPPEGQAPDDGHPDLPEVRDIPEGWREDKCICNGAIIYEPGNVHATAVHLDPALDEDHKADPIF